MLWLILFVGMMCVFVISFNVCASELRKKFDEEFYGIQENKERAGEDNEI